VEDANFPQEPQNSEADVGAPKNLIGVKRAKRMCALEREHQKMKATVEKMQHDHSEVFTHCLSAARSEAQHQVQGFLSDLHSHWCQLLGSNTSDMSPLAIEVTLEKFDKYQNQQKQFGPPPSQSVLDGLMGDDLFGGARVR